MPFIDATIVMGRTKSFSGHIETQETAGAFSPLDLSSYSIRFRVLGAPTADAKVLVEHLITQNTELEVDGVIDNPTNGDFIFTITKDDTITLGLGNHPIEIMIVDAETLEEVFSLTEGGQRGEFNKIQIVQA